MKIIMSAFVVGIVIGSVVSVYLLTINTPLQGTMKISTSNPEAIISQTNLLIQQNHRVITLESSFTTDKEGTYTNRLTLNKRELQYNHALSVEGGYWINSMMPYLAVRYHYKTFLLSMNVGYSLKIGNIDYGIGMGYHYRF